jgi:uncharacterized protein YdeI (YjbR/CyaY-like superfamily)
LFREVIRSVPEGPLPFGDRAAWREWLDQHHSSETELWLMFYKKHTGVPSVTYQEAVEEAICFGWIDGMLRRLDEDRYIQKFTPRKETSTWSKTNMERAERMIAGGRMAPAGLRKYQERSLRRPMREQLEATGIEMSAPLLEALQRNPAAWEHFNRLPPSLKKQYVGWVMSAKKEETQLRRLDELADVLSRGERLGLK